MNEVSILWTSSLIYLKVSKYQVIIELIIKVNAECRLVQDIQIESSKSKQL
jgi:hypothetical protein